MAIPGSPGGVSGRLCPVVDFLKGTNRVEVSLAQWPQEVPEIARRAGSAPPPVRRDPSPSRGTTQRLGRTLLETRFLQIAHWFLFCPWRFPAIRWLKAFSFVFRPGFPFNPRKVENCSQRIRTSPKAAPLPPTSRSLEQTDLPWTGATWRVPRGICSFGCT